MPRFQKFQFMSESTSGAPIYAENGTDRFVIFYRFGNREPGAAMASGNGMVLSLAWLRGWSRGVKMAADQLGDAHSLRWLSPDEYEAAGGVYPPVAAGDNLPVAVGDNPDSR